MNIRFPAALARRMASEALLGTEPSFSEVKVPSISKNAIFMFADPKLYAYSFNTDILTDTLFTA